MNTEFLNTEIYKELVERNSPFIENINKLYSYCENILPQINRVFANYTGHGINHSVKLVEYMAELPHRIKDLDDLELTIMIYTALLHDIGMVVTENEIDKIKIDDISISDRKYSLVLEKYKNENLAIQECIRPIHGLRSFKHIASMDDKYFILPGSTNTSFKEEVQLICQSHNESFEWIKTQLSQLDKKGDYQINTQYLSLLLRLSDLLDIDETRTPLYMYNIINPMGYGELEWQQHFVVENKNKIIMNSETKLKQIEFYGKSNKPEIHRKLLKYFDYINDELKNAIGLSESFHESKYNLLLKLNVENKIQTKGFNFSDFKLNLDYNAVTSLLMGEHIYGDKKYGLRELIQNSIDACMLMNEVSKNTSQFTYIGYKPFINIILNKDKKTVSIEDNGIGMSLNILQKYFLNVGISYYSSDEYKFKGYNYNPIGNYGIGFLACFMLSDSVTVNTKKYSEVKLNEINLEKNSEYICLTYRDDPKSQGTEIILDYDHFFNIFKENSDDVKKFIEQNFIYCQIPIQIIEVDNGSFITKLCELNSLKDNSMKTARLDKYLNNIEACIDLNCDIDFISTVHDLDFNKSYFIDEYDKTLQELNKSPDNSIHKYIKNNSLEYIQLPIISDTESEKFSNALEILDDFDDALNKINNVELINIFFKHDESLSQTQIDSNDQIISDYYFELFSADFSHDENVPTYRYIINENVVTYSNNPEVILFNKNTQIGGNYSFERKDQIFIKNVFIPKFHVTLPFMISGIQMKGATINIKNKNVVPNVSRNDVNTNTNLLFSYAIGKALHLWLLDNLDITHQRKELLQSFIQDYYSEENPFIK